MKVTHTPAGSLITRHGERYVYTSYGCRCDPCKDANTEYIARRREERIARARIPESVGHGKAATANNWGCKCQLCLDAKAEDNHSQYEARKKKLAEGGYPDLKHGVSAYTSYGCRCDVCRDAVKAKGAERRESGEVPETVTHGKRSTYIRWSCRCPLCKAAEAAYYRKRKEEA